MPVTEYLRATSHRQHLAWLAWLEMQWNLPDRHDNYLMRIAYEIRCGNVKDPKKVKMSDFYMPFNKKAGKSVSGASGNQASVGTQGLTKEQASKIALARWIMVAGPPRGHKGATRLTEKKPTANANDPLTKKFETLKRKQRKAK